MLAALTRYIRRHHIGLVALFVALGGTAYAVQIAPKDSVVSRSIEDGQVKVRDVKLTKTVNFPDEVEVAGGTSQTLEPFDVKFPPSGLVSMYVTSQMVKNASGESPCRVMIGEAGSALTASLLTYDIDLGRYLTVHTAPGSGGNGTFQREDSGSVVLPDDPGKTSFQLTYRAFGSASCGFKDTRVVIIPVP